MVTIIMIFKICRKIASKMEIIFFQVFTLFLGACIRLYEYGLKYFSREEIVKQENLLRGEQNYSEWLKIATRLDEMNGNLGWRFIPESSHYDHVYIKNMKLHLESLLDANKIRECSTLLRGLIKRDFSGISNLNLYNYTLSGTKELIDQYYETIKTCFTRIADSDMSNKLEFFTELKHFYGRTGIIFSGGASIGMFHLGVVSALLEFDLLPKVFCGSSAGAMVCAFVGSNTDEELLALSKSNFSSFNFNAFNEIPRMGSIFRKILRVFKDGYLINKEPLKKFLMENSYNLTFKEAYTKTGRIINIIVTDSHHRKFHTLNYITAPDVFLWSAALASCSLPVVFRPSNIVCKMANGNEESWMPRDHVFIDGSIGADVPMKSLSVMFNVTSFIVSQVNFYVIPFISYSRFNRFSRKYFLFKIWEMACGFLLSEFRYRLKQLSKLGWLPQGLSLLANIVMQKYFGNVTILPHVGLDDYLSLFDNPSPDSVRKWTLKGRNSTFLSYLTRSQANY
jgi:TAG lipase/steryl ester hydrolase/phospholipase A2/LPA acyltransferase